MEAAGYAVAADEIAKRHQEVYPALGPVACRMVMVPGPDIEGAGQSMYAVSGRYYVGRESPSAILHARWLVCIQGMRKAGGVLWAQ